MGILSAEQIEFLESRGYSQPVGIDTQIWAFHPDNPSGVMPSPIPEAIAKKAYQLQAHIDLLEAQRSFEQEMCARNSIRRSLQKELFLRLKHFWLSVFWPQRRLWSLERPWDSHEYFNPDWVDSYCSIWEYREFVEGHRKQQRETRAWRWFSLIVNIPRRFLGSRFDGILCRSCIIPVEPEYKKYFIGYCRRCHDVEERFAFYECFDSPWSEAFVIHPLFGNHPTGRNYRI